MKTRKKQKKQYKVKRSGVNGYLRVGSMYISRGFIISGLVAFIAVAVLYMTALHPVAVALWYERQALPEFSIDSPHLAGYTGRAKLFLTDGTLLYEGEVSGAVVGGSGKLYQNGLLLYDGEFKDNMYQGRGTLYAADGVVTYSGDFADNLPHGLGTLYYTRDSVGYSYTGTFDSGVQSGEGTLHSGDALVYEGGFKDNMRDGYGREYAYGRLRYEGSFMRDAYEGEGKLFDRDGRLIYEGGFVSGKYGGDGTEYNPDTGYPVFEGKYLDGGRMEAGVEYDAQGLTVVTPAIDSDPLDLVGATYTDALAALSANSATCREQSLDGLRLIIDEAGGVIYAFSLNETGEPEAMAEMYLCGLASAGGHVVGSEIDVPAEMPARIAEIGAGERFALSLSNAIWGKETREDALVCVTHESGGQSITAFCEAVEEPLVLPDKFTKVLPGDLPEDKFAKELPGDVSPMKAGRIVFIRVGRSAPDEEALPMEE